MLTKARVVRGFSALMIVAGVVGLPSLPDDAARWIPLVGGALDTIGGFVTSPWGRFVLVLVGVWMFLESIGSGFARRGPQPPVEAPRAPARNAHDILMERADRAIESLSDKVLVPKTTVPEPFQERIFTMITPAELQSFYNGHTIVEGDRLARPHINKWMELSGVVSDVSERGADTNYGFVMVALEGAESGPWVTLYFRREWREKAGLLRKGQQISVIGRIDKTSRMGLELEECELVAEPPARLRPPRRSKGDASRRRVSGDA